MLFYLNMVLLLNMLKFYPSEVFCLLVILSCTVEGQSLYLTHTDYLHTFLHEVVVITEYIFQMLSFVTFDYFVHLTLAPNK